MSESMYKIGILIFPGVTQLDFTGPAEVLARMPGAEISLVWKTLDPVTSQFGLKYYPNSALNLVNYDGGTGMIKNTREQVFTPPTYPNTIL